MSLFDIATVCARIRHSSSGVGGGATASAEPQASTFYNSGQPGTERTIDGVNGRDSEAFGPQPKELDQISASLEKEIEAMLERHDTLLAECASLRTKTEALSQALTERQTAAALEAEQRAAAEKKHAEDISALQSALDSERAGMADQLARERKEWQQQLESREQALNKTQQHLEARSTSLQREQATVSELRKEIGELEQQWEDYEKSLAKARDEAKAEQAARLAAEEQIRRAAEAQKSLERDLLERKGLQQQVQAHVASINSLCRRLQAKKAARVG